MLNVPNARIGIPPGSDGAGMAIGFFVPHFTVNSFVFTKRTSARTPLLNPNLKPFKVDRNGMISDSISKLPSSLKIPSILPLYIKMASCPARIIKRLPFLISRFVHFQKIQSSLYSSHSTTFASCFPNNPMTFLHSAIYITNPSLPLMLPVHHLLPHPVVLNHTLLPNCQYQNLPVTGLTLPLHWLHLTSYWLLLPSC